MRQPPFTYHWYRQLLAACRECRSITTLAEAASGVERSAILRHDIDFDIECASTLAEIEYEERVSSTYFVLVSSDFYNPGSRGNRERLRRLAERGFEIGLHFDPSVHGGASAAALQAALESERSFLETVVGREVRSVSLHTPTALGEYPLFDGLHNAYDPRWFQPDRYLSDSRRRWLHDPVEFVRSVPLSKVLQILTHPIHFADTERSYREMFRSIEDRATRRRDDYMLTFNSTYRDELALEREGMKIAGWEDEA